MTNITLIALLIANAALPVRPTALPPTAVAPAKAQSQPTPTPKASDKVQTTPRRALKQPAQRRSVKSRKMRPVSSATEPVRNANQAALQKPSAYGFVNAVQIYPYTQGALYQLYGAPERITDIALDEGETLIAVAAGDTVRWIIGDTSSGSGATKRTHILVKPTAPDLRTNLVITTDKRSYHLDLQSTAKTAMAALSWDYPADHLLALKNATTAVEAQTPIASGLKLESLNFGYAIRGDSPSWRPLRAFDDGAQVFIEFSSSLGQGEAPPLFVIGSNGEAELVNYRVRGNYYIVDRLFTAAELRLGTKDSQAVRISTASPDRRQKSKKGRGQ
jgi:type IV secretion system protein VirB9